MCYNTLYHRRIVSVHSSCGSDRDPPPPLGSLQLVPVTRIEIFFRNDRGSTDTRGIGNVSDDSEVFFVQPEESAGALGPEGSSRSRHKKETGFEETEPHRGARPRKMDLDQPVDDERVPPRG